MSTPQAPRLRPCARSLTDSLREFLTPAIWKHAHRARRHLRPSARWATQPLILTLVLLTWACGDSQAEKFEAARGCCVSLLAKRRRPGRTVAGFRRALARLPLAALRAVAAGVRQQLLRRLDLLTDGFVVLGCGGSALEGPRSAELEQRLAPKGKANAAPALIVTALVHLRTGLLWAWRLGNGDACERQHLRRLLPTLPPRALVVADAGFNGHELARAIAAAGASYLIRMSAKVTLYAQEAIDPATFTDGTLLSWPQEIWQAGRGPLACRLIRVRGRRTKKGNRYDVWLLTNILDPKRLSAEQAGRYYRQRWESEGLFRTYKRTLGKVKLQSRTVRLVHREVEGTLLGTQLLLALGARAVSGARTDKAEAAQASARKVLRVIREEISGGRLGQSFGEKLARAAREDRPRTSAKEKKQWPQRRTHKPPKPPHLLKLPDALKRKLDKLLQGSP
jgi:hypothetical protein